MRPHHASLLALLALIVPAAALAVGGTPRGAGRAAGAGGMARIPAGTYRPLYAAAGAERVRVAAFALDRRPVTRAEYLAFVRAHPEWRRGGVSPHVAEAGYLRDWRGPLDAGSGVELRRPVTAVSWFAAKAYCAAQGKRLPTLDEWEYAAAASAHARDAGADPVRRRELLALYSARRSDRLPAAGSGAANVYGVRDLHGSAWEWTHDFDTVAGADGSRVSGSGPHAHDHRLYCASAAIGAADPTAYPAFLRFAVRAGLTTRTTLDGLGFRCAADRAP